MSHQDAGRYGVPPPGDDAMASLAATLDSALKAASRVQGGTMQASAVVVEEGGMAGALRLAVACVDDDEAATAVKLMAAALKGLLVGQGPHHQQPLQVVHVQAPPDAHAALLRCMLYPALCLAACEVRRALLLCGGDGAAGGGLVSLAADAGQGPPMFECFAPTELKVCRGDVVLCLDHPLTTGVARDGTFGVNIL